MIYRQALTCCLCVAKLDSVHVHACVVLRLPHNPLQNWIPFVRIFMPYSFCSAQLTPSTITHHTYVYHNSRIFSSQDMRHIILRGQRVPTVEYMYIYIYIYLSTVQSTALIYSLCLKCKMLFTRSR